jgi:hypothetical protein
VRWRATDDPEERARRLEEGEQILEAGATAHDHVFFCREAIEISLEARDWPAVLRYADLLERQFREEPFAFVDYVAARARALAAVGPATFSAARPHSPRRQLSLAKFMADKGPGWDRIVQKHGLKPYRYEEIVSWPYGDFVFTAELDIVSGSSPPPCAGAPLRARNAIEASGSAADVRGEFPGPFRLRCDLPRL